MKHDIGLLILRAVPALTMLFAHGWGKLTNFTNIMGQFPDPLGVGSSVSLALAVFAEVFCAAALALGIFTRWVSLPLIVTMIVAFFVIHGADPWQKKELSFMYLVFFLVTLLLGPGKLSFDGWVRKKPH
jgi:putative oxidoreductase